METWPATFPLPTTSFGADEAGNALRTEMDSGTIRQRRRFSADRVTVDAQWEMGDTEFGVFCAWHKFKINAGSDWFNMVLPLGGGYENHVVRFVGGRYSQSYEEVDNWKVSATLEVQQRVTFSEALLDLYLEVGSNDESLTNFIDVVNRFHLCVHQTLPANLN